MKTRIEIAIDTITEGQYDDLMALITDALNGTGVDYTMRAGGVE